MIGRVVDAVKSGLGNDDGNRVCVHHRDGPDWHSHCANWETIPDGIWRQNCKNEAGRSLSMDIKSRLLPSNRLPPILYVGDHLPPPELEEAGEAKTIKPNVIILLLFRSSSQVSPLLLGKSLYPMPR